jgi:hypothetical protein
MSQNEPFRIFHSEALIIGCCFEEYLQFRNHVPDWPFLGAIHLRVEPFIPDFKLITGGQIPPSEIPSDIVWKDGEGDQFGIAASHPNTLFPRNARGVFRRVLDASRHNLRSLLLFYLDTAVGLSPQYRRFVQGWRENPNDLIPVQLRYDEEVSSAGPDYRDENGVDDDPASIELLLARLAQLDVNAAQDIFELGRNFGRLCATLRLYEYGCSKTSFVVSFLKTTMKLYQAKPNSRQLRVL